MHFLSKGFLEGSLSLELYGKQFSSLWGFTVRAIAMEKTISEVPSASNLKRIYARIFFKQLVLISIWLCEWTRLEREVEANLEMAYWRSCIFLCWLARLQEIQSAKAEKVRQAKLFPNKERRKNVPLLMNSLLTKEEVCDQEYKEQPNFPSLPTKHEERT